MLTLKRLFKPLGCLQLKCLPRNPAACSNDGHASCFAEAPLFLATHCWSLPAYCSHQCHKILGPLFEWYPMGCHIVNIMGPPLGFWGCLWTCTFGLVGCSVWYSYVSTQ